MASKSDTLDTAAESLEIDQSTAIQPDNTGIMSLAGTYGTLVATIQGSYDGTNYVNLGAVRVDTLAFEAAGALTFTDDAERAWRFDLTGVKKFKFTVTSIASGEVTVSLSSFYTHGNPLNLTLSNLTSGNQTVSGNLSMADSAKIQFGDAQDITMAWDGTDFDVLQATPNSSIKWGISGAGIDQVWYGDTAAADMTWDQSADTLIFGDNAKIALGTGSDITLAWDGTDLDILQATVNSSIKWGIDGAGIDQVWYGDTASTNMTWDQSADSLIFTGAGRIVFTGTTGQPEIHLTDNLADALSIEISGSTDLLTFCTTNDAESVSPIGLRTRSSTAVAITGATELKLSDSGGIFTVSQGAAYDIDLPSPTSGPGCRYFFSLTGAAANNVTITVVGGAATFVGSVITEGQIVVATGATLTFASGVSVLGDSIEIQSIATNLYHVRAVSSILNGITIA